MLRHGFSYQFLILNIKSSKAMFNWLKKECKGFFGMFYFTLYANFYEILVIF